MYLNLNQKFYLSIKILELSNMNEEALALLISHELAHFLLEH